MSVTTSMSSSNGCAALRSSSETPCLPSTRSPLNSMRPLDSRRGGSATRRPAALACAPQVGRLRDELATARPELASRKPLCDGDRRRPGGNPSRPEQEATDCPYDSVPELLLMDEHALSFAQPLVELQKQLP